MAFWWERYRRPRESERAIDALSFAQWLEMFTWNGTNIPFFPSQSLVGQKQEIGGSYMGLVEGAYKSDAIVFALMLTRQMLFSQVSFKFRRLDTATGRLGDYFGSTELQPLEQPWPNGQTSDLLARAIQDVDLAGNFYGRRVVGPGIQRLRPDWVTIILGETLAGVHAVGYLYQEGGPGSGEDPIRLSADEVAHWAPIPDPSAWFRGMSWLTPVIREVQGDLAATTHYQAFYENGATPNLIMKMDPSIDEETTKQWVQLWREGYEGAANAFKTMFVGGGADPVVVGANLRQLDFTSTQSHLETRLAAAARVPPMLAYLSEGMSAATYSNMQIARRIFADGTARPLWEGIASSFSNIITPPAGGGPARLTYDDRDVAWLAEDQTDLAKVQQQKAATINTLITAGFDADSAVAAVEADDFGQLQHSGMVSVQLLPPGESQNGSTNGAIMADNQDQPVPSE